jgi:mono/diheme cytochrome c family protein
MALATALPLLAQAALAADGPADAGAGKKLYVANCQSCHGNKGQGAVGKRLAGDAAYWDFPIFKRTVIEGITTRTDV